MYKGPQSWQKEENWQLFNNLHTILTIVRYQLLRGTVMFFHLLNCFFSNSILCVIATIKFCQCVALKI